MSIYPEDIAGSEFVVASDGFDRDEVRAFLKVVAQEQQALRDEIAGLREELAGKGDVGKEVGLVLETAKASAEDAVRLAEEEADQMRKRAEVDAERMRLATLEASARAREEADLYAFTTRAEADSEARRRLEETNARIERLLAGATKVRDRLFGLDTILASARNEIGEAATVLDDVGDLETSDVPSAPVVDLRAAR